MEIEANRTQQLAEYVKKNFGKGYTADSLKYSLLSQGYSRTAIEHAIKSGTKKFQEEQPRIIRTIYTTKNVPETSKSRKMQKQTPFQKFCRLFIRR